MTTKERAKLRSIAMTLQPTTHIGKNGVTDEVITQIEEQLQAHELIKINVLKNSDFTAKEIAEGLAESAGAEVVQVLGNKITLYKVSTKDGIKHVLEI